MNIADVYPRFSIEFVKGKGLTLKDKDKRTYLDFYSGHGVISVGHRNEAVEKSLKKQLKKLPFYSNAFDNSLQPELARKLGRLSQYEKHTLFLSNSGAEANENAIKIAMQHTGRNKVLAVKGAFHGRTLGAVGVTDNPEIKNAHISNFWVDFIELNNDKALIKSLSSKEYAAIIMEGIQGVGGVYAPSALFWNLSRELCTQTGTLLIADEIQSGYGRTGKFFAHQHAGIEADLVTTAKGMGNGFPIAGTLIASYIETPKGSLGSTFGGGQLACAAAIAVLDELEQKNMMGNAIQQGRMLLITLERMDGIKAVRGTGLMIGFTPVKNAKEVQKELLEKHGIVTGFSYPDVIRLLPPLCVNDKEVNQLLTAIQQSI